MDTKWKHRIAYSITIAIGLVGIYLTIKLASKPSVQAVPTSNAPTNPADGTQVGAPNVTIIGGNYPINNLPPASSLPSGANGVAGNQTQLYLPVITNYNQTQNGGCGSCAGNAPDSYYASAITANEYITAAMMKQLGYTKAQNGQVYKPGYYNLEDQTSTQILSFLNGL
jgi:hypothetical protein